jgi:type IV pilus assembly protein PilW
VARSAQPVPLGDNQAGDVGRFVDCNDVVQNPVDRFLRRSYRTTVFLRNARPAVPAAFQLDGIVVQNPYRHLSSSN